MIRPITTFGKYLMLMGRVFGRPERFRMYFKQYVNEMYQLGINIADFFLHRCGYLYPD